MAKYEVIVYSKAGLPMGNIFSMCQNFQWTKTRNEAEAVSFEIDLHHYEQFLQQAGFGSEPFGFMEVGRNDIRIKRNGQWLLGANIIKFDYSVTDTSIVMKVSCSGYLNFYKSQYVDIAYTNTPQEQIIWGVINQCNAKYGADYGITQGVHRGGTVLRDRNQIRKEVKLFIQQMTQVLGGPDIEITADKKLNTFDAMGTYRPDVRLTYPGNISNFSFARSVEKVSNFIYGIGSGNGEDAVQAEAEDQPSEDYLYRREQIATYNSVVEEATLQQNIEAIKYYSKDPIELPKLTIQNDVLDLSSVGIGDTLPVEFQNVPTFAHINGYYRIESITCRVDENGSESPDITFDDIDVAGIIQLQEAGNET